MTSPMSPASRNGSRSRIASLRRVRVGSLNEQNHREGQLGQQPDLAGVDTEVKHPESDGSEQQTDAHEHQRAA